MRHFLRLLAGHILLLSATAVAAPGLGSTAPPLPIILVTNDLRLEKDVVLKARLIVRASHVEIDGNGATLIGPGDLSEPKSWEDARVGVLIEGATGVILKNLKAKGFSIGLHLRHTRAVTVSDCDFSNNYHNPKHGWGELPPRGGVLCEDVRHSVFRGNRANQVWDGIHLVDSDDNLVTDNDFSHCSNTCAKLWHSRRNRFLNNNLSYGIRIDRAAGEVHARDSTSVLVETGSDDNYWYRNDMRHGGDGIFIRPLNRWVSRGNMFVENDTSYANNNCVESWSPGNTFIRNKANHGSYGFWLGGSDHTVLIGNEAAFNGRPDGYHNAPEAGFGHGGIVVVGGSSSHTVIEGNYLHDNNGAGIAFRGDTASQGQRWRTEHWIIQQNRIVSNRFGIWGRWGDAILLAGNVITNNAQGNYLTNVSNLLELPATRTATAVPIARISGPTVLRAGQPATFDARTSLDPGGQPLSFRWWLKGPAGNGSIIERVFQNSGHYRLGLTVDNGTLASLDWRDLLVVEPVALELGTEGDASRWGFELELNEHGRGRILFEDDPDAVVGSRSLRVTPSPYPGAYAAAVFPAARNAGWNFAGRQHLRLWIKSQNPNLPGYQNAGPVIRLQGRRGHLEFKPARDANLLNDPPFSEARWLWMPLSVPLNGSVLWTRTVIGEANLDQIDALSISIDSWGGDPFTIWLDGLEVQ